MNAMKHLRLFLFLIAAVLAISAPGYGQDGPPPGDGPRDEHADRGRLDLLAELGLSREQVQQMRRMNQERRPAMMEAQRRLREANRNLDMAIYADTLSDTDFQNRLSEFRSAQSEMAKLRFESELAVRRILTPDQLVRFRELRQKVAEERQNEMRDRRMRQNGRGMQPGRDVPPRRPPLND